MTLYQLRQKKIEELKVAKQQKTNEHAAKLTKIFAENEKTLSKFCRTGKTIFYNLNQTKKEIKSRKLEDKQILGRVFYK